MSCIYNISHAHHIVTNSVFAQRRFSLQVCSCTNDSGRLLGSLAFAGNSHKRRHSHEGLAGWSLGHSDIFIHASSEASAVKSYVFSVWTLLEVSADVNSSSFSCRMISSFRLSCRRFSWKNTKNCVRSRHFCWANFPGDPQVGHHSTSRWLGEKFQPVDVNQHINGCFWIP